MNSLFNYELDENKIRLTLHDAELEYSDVSWTEFDNEYPADVATPTKFSQINLPKISLNINRNVLVPIFFIIALGSVSAIMFKFIDFKANKPVEAERALESSQASLNIQNNKPEQPVKKETPPPVVSVPVKTDSVKVENTLATVVPTLATQNTEPAKIQSTEPARVQSTEPSVAQRNFSVNNGSSSSSVPDTTQKNTTVTASSDKPPEHTIYYKKRRKKLVIDQVETIKAPSLISAQSTETEEEPELKIKQN